MNEKELMDVLDSWENISLTVKEIVENPEYFPVLIKTALYNNEPKSWRAAYIVDLVHDYSPELLLPYLNEVTLQLKQEKSNGKKRHFMKLISMNKIDEEHHGFLFDYCLTTLTSAKEPLAVRVHAMQILFNISDIETGLKPEILSVIEHEMEFHAAPSILSRGKKLAKKLRKQIE